MRSFATQENDENENWRGEPETVDVWAQQDKVDWSKQPFSDQLLGPLLVDKLREIRRSHA